MSASDTVFEVITHATRSLIVQTNRDQQQVCLGIGSVKLWITVHEFGEVPLIGFWCDVLSNPTPDQELLRFLNELNFQIPFGNFGLDNEGTVVLKYGLLGDELTAAEVRLVADTLGTFADRYDDELQGRFGGERAVDRQSERF